MEIPDCFDLAFTSSMQDAVIEQSEKDAAFAQVHEELLELMEIFENSMSDEQKGCLRRLMHLKHTWRLRGSAGATSKLCRIALLY